MGQSSSQRRAQQQDVELWELYEGDGRRGERSRRREKADRGDWDRKARNTGTGSRDGRNRNTVMGNRTGDYGRSGERKHRSQEEDRDGRSGGRNRRSADERRRERDYIDGNSPIRESGRGMERTGSLSRGSLDVVNVRRDTGSRNSTRKGGSGRPADARQGSRERQRANASRTSRTGRVGDASQIKYIQPYSGSAQRAGNSAYAYKGNARPVQSIRRRRARRRKELLGKAGIVLLMAFCLMMIYFITGQIYQMTHRGSKEKTEDSIPAVAEKIFQEDSKVGPPDMIEDLLEINEYSRPGTPLDKINSIFVHYTANPGTSAAQNRSYFANLAQTHERSASAHLIIGYDGELIQCIPFDEQAYAVMTRNEDSISIECCYLSEDGSFTQETYDTLVHTLAWLLKEYDLSTEDILRHYDCGGKLCPLYYAENEGAWEDLRQDVAAYMAAAE